MNDADVARYEVSAEEAEAWARAQLSETLGEMRGNTLEFVQRLRARTEKLREENRRTWDDGVANAPPELRDAAERLRSRLHDLGAALRRAAREHGATPAPGAAEEGEGKEPPQ